MNQEWQRVPFADLLVDSRDGEWGEGVSAIGLQACDLIRGTDFSSLTDPDVSLPLRWIPDRLVERKQLQVGDIVFEMAGGTAKQSTGRSAFVAQSFLKSRQRPVLCASFCRHLRLDRERFEPRFVYYLLQALYAAGYMGVFNIQHTGVSRFQYTSFKKHTELRIPRLSTQKKIAAALAAYDDLIENNRRRIALLERMAEQLYREWFVRFRFPGYQNAKFEKGLPKDWSLKPLSKAVRINPTERPTASEAKPYVGMEDLSLTSMYFSSKEKRTKNAGSKFRNRDILFPRITPSLENGKRGFVMGLQEGEVAIGSTEFIVLRERLIGAEQIYFLSCSSDLRTHAEQSMVGASGRQRVQEKCFDSFMVAVPPVELSKRFSELIQPFFDQTFILENESVLLKRARDLLLPRLISGKLRMDDLDIEFPPSMQSQA